MGHYREQITVRCSIKFRIPIGQDEESMYKLLPQNIKDWDDWVYDEHFNTVYCEYTYTAIADCHSSNGDYWTPPHDVIEHFDEYNLKLPKDLIISEVHDVID